MFTKFDGRDSNPFVEDQLFKYLFLNNIKKKLGDYLNLFLADILLFFFNMRSVFCHIRIMCFLLFIFDSFFHFFFNQISIAYFMMEIINCIQGR